MKKLIVFLVFALLMASLANAFLYRRIGTTGFSVATLKLEEPAKVALQDMSIQAYQYGRPVASIHKASIPIEVGISLFGKGHKALNPDLNGIKVFALAIYHDGSTLLNQYNADISSVQSHFAPSQQMVYDAVRGELVYEVPVPLGVGFITIYAFASQQDPFRIQHQKFEVKVR